MKRHPQTLTEHDQREIRDFADWLRAVQGQPPLRDNEPVPLVCALDRSKESKQ
jgi:hypothetical protein